MLSDCARKDHSETKDSLAAIQPLCSRCDPTPLDELQHHVLQSTAVDEPCLLIGRKECEGERRAGEVYCLTLSHDGIRY